MKRLLPLLCLLTGLFFTFSPTVSAQVFWEDNFEGTGPNLGDGDRDAPNHTDGDNGSGPGVCGAGDYFFRTDNPGGAGDPDGLDVMFTNIEGSFYWRGEDLDGCFVNPDQLNFEGIDISTRTNLQFTGRFGVRSGNTRWEADDYIRVSYQIDGGGYTLGLAFVSDLVSGAFGNLAQDSNLDGTADGTILSESLTDFMFSIPGSGTTLDLRIEILADGGGEEFAIDLFQVAESTPVIVCPTILGLEATENMVCPDALFDLLATGLENMADVDNNDQDYGIQFVAFTSAPADPYVGGINLGAVPYADLSGGDAQATLNGASLSVPGNYTAYAILSPAPADTDCRPSAFLANFEVIQPVPITFQPPGDFCFDVGIQTQLSGATPTGGVYSGSNVTDNGDGETFSFDPGAAGVGVFSVTYTGMCSSTASQTIEVFALPEVSFTAFGSVEVNAGIQTGLGGATPIGGVYSGTGVIDDGNGMTYTFDPAAVGVGTYELTYTYTDGNGCSNFASDMVEVFICEQAVINGIDIIECDDINGFITLSINGDLNGADHWEWVEQPGEVEMTCEEQDVLSIGQQVTVLFVFPSRTHYVRAVGGCLTEPVCFGFVPAELLVTAELTLAVTSYCVDAGIQTGLDGGTPTGGIYSGPGVTDDSNGMTFSFDPATAGAGTHSITYTTTGECGGDATASIEVFATPNVTFTPIPNEFTLGSIVTGNTGGAPAGGMYSGPGVTDNGNGMTYTFDPDVAGIGTHVLTYIYTNGNGCSGSANASVDVFTCVQPVISGIEVINCGGVDGFSTLRITGQLNGANSWEWTLPSDGVEIVCENQTTFNTGQEISVLFTNPSLTYYVRAVGGCITEPVCFGFVPAELLETAALSLAVDTYCVDAGVQTGLGGGIPIGGMYSGPGVIDDGNGMTFSFNPGTAGVGSQTITYTITSCASSAMANIEVVSPVVSFTPVPSVFMLGSVYPGNGGGTPVGGVYSGPGVTDDGNGMSYTFDADVAGLGVHTLTYIYTDGNGCSGSAIGAVTVVEMVVCPEGDLVLLSQADVDAYVAAYPDCPVITGNLVIGNGMGSTDINDISGLSNLTTIGGNLSVFYNDNLNSLEGLEGITSVGGGLYVFRNNALTDLTGLNGLSSVGGVLYVFFNGNLSNLTGLDALSSVGGFVTIRSNPALTSLTGLETLTSINGFLAIRSNTSLTNIEGLVNIDTAGISRLYITGNSLLSDCAIDNVCAYLTVEANLASITKNANKCNNRSQVESACTDTEGLVAADSAVAEDNNTTFGKPMEVNTNEAATQIKLFPNPTTGLLQIRNAEEVERVMVYSPQGQQLARYHTSLTELDMSMLPAGVYYLSFFTATERHTVRVVKVE